jgi:hypothetical protein
MCIKQELSPATSTSAPVSRTCRALSAPIATDVSAFLAEWVATQPAGLEHMVDDRVALAAAPAAFDRLASGQLDASKILVLPQEHGERVGRP